MDVTDFLSPETKSKIPYDCMMDIITGADKYAKRYMVASDKDNYLIPSHLLSKVDNKVVSDCFDWVYCIKGLNVKQIKSGVKQRHYVESRALISRYLNEHKNMSHKIIGVLLGGINHTSITYLKKGYWTNEYSPQHHKDYKQLEKYMKCD